jgi:hypothetical protein
VKGNFGWRWSGPLSVVSGQLLGMGGGRIVGSLVANDGCLGCDGNGWKPLELRFADAPRAKAAGLMKGRFILSFVSCPWSVVGDGWCEGR